MGKRTQRKMFMGGSASFFLCLGLLAVCFFLGMIGGQVSAKRSSESTISELHQYLTGYCGLDAAEESSAEIFLNAFLIYFRYPLLAFCLGFTGPGALLLPGLSAAFGFFLSFAACCFARVFGRAGVLLALSVLGLRCLITLPCFFVLAVQTLHSTGGMLFFRGKPAHKRMTGLERWLVVCVVAAILLVGALAEAVLSPILMEKFFQTVRI